MPLLSLCLALLAHDPAPIVLTRKFTPNVKLAYNLTSHITAEIRAGLLDTFIPSDFDINYGFDYTVKSVSNDGIAVVRYNRPSITEIEGETATSAPKPKTEKSNWIYDLTISPVNEVLEFKDLTPKKPGKKAASDDRVLVAGAARPQAPIFGDYIGEMHRLALFVGGVDSGLDFSPKLPLEPIKVGSTWQRTIGYQPQKLKGDAKGKSAVQRLDYTFTYVGPMKSDAGKPILRVQAKLDLNTDLADYLRTLLEEDADKTNLKTMPLHMKATIDFDLDPNTRETLSAAAASEGGWELFVKERPEALYEERFKGRTNLELVGRKVVGSVPPMKRPVRRRPR